ncbi:MORN repeat-containing protein [Halpernia sp.]|uniref:MORN repeat-containing protein n=1 Tax=Halpernia sp. TaxID=2782209 RepID=UPI003A8E8429
MRQIFNLKKCLLFLSLFLVCLQISGQLGEKDQNGMTYGERDMAKTAAQTAKGNTPYSPRGVDKNAVEKYVNANKQNRPETPAERLAKYNAEKTRDNNYLNEVKAAEKDAAPFLNISAEDFIDKNSGFCKGDCENGKGSLTLPHGEVFVGLFLNGKANGRGQINKDAKNAVVSFYKNGLREGKAAIYSSEGVLRLSYVKNKAFGPAEFQFSNGDKRNYNYNNGVVNGVSFYTFANSNDYVKDLYLLGKKLTTFQAKKGSNMYPSETMKNAAWVWDETLQAKKTFFESTAFYSGEHNNLGRKHGQGIYAWDSGRFYIGQWKRGNMDGFGQMVYPNGDYYEGEFNNDKKNGKGITYYVNGLKYEGEYKDDKMDGKGKIIFPNGKYYTAKFVKDKMEGEANLILPDGSHAFIFYENDKQTGGKYFNANGKEINKSEFTIIEDNF